MLGVEGDEQAADALDDEHLGSGGCGVRGGDEVVEAQLDAGELGGEVGRERGTERDRGDVRRVTPAAVESSS